MTIQNYRLKSVSVSAAQWTGENFNEILELTEVNDIKKRSVYKSGNMDKIGDKFFVLTSHGSFFAKIGDYITRDSEGNLNYYDNESFNKLYEPEG